MSTDMIWETSSTSFGETEKLGELLGSKLSGGEVIELRSDLGGGKTTFTAGIARGAGSREQVTSPTFTLSKIYKTPKFQIHHFDFYRLNDPGIMADQLAEAVSEPTNVVIVEWAGIVNDVLPPNRLDIELRLVVSGPDERKIIFKYPLKMEQLINSLQTSWQEVRP